MKKTSFNESKRNFLRTGLVALTNLAIPAYLLGCATSGKQGGLFGNYGDLSGSKEVTKSFENYELKDNLNYFIAGARKDSPSAILGLDNQYILDNTKFWHPLNSQDKTLQELVGNMKDDSENATYGANVLDHYGNDIGDWYSASNTTTIKLKDGKRVVVYTPRAGISGGGSSPGAGPGGPSGGGTAGGGI